MNSWEDTGVSVTEMGRDSVSGVVSGFRFVEVVCGGRRRRV